MRSARLLCANSSSTFLCSRFKRSPKYASCSWASTRAYWARRSLFFALTLSRQQMGVLDYPRLRLSNPLWQAEIPSCSTHIFRMPILLTRLSYWTVSCASTVPLPSNLIVLWPPHRNIAMETTARINCTALYRWNDVCTQCHSPLYFVLTLSP